MDRINQMLRRPIYILPGLQSVEDVNALSQKHSPILYPICDPVADDYQVSEKGNPCLPLFLR